MLAFIIGAIVTRVEQMSYNPMNSAFELLHQTVPCSCQMLFAESDSSVMYFRPSPTQQEPEVPYD